MLTKYASMTISLILSKLTEGRHPEMTLLEYSNLIFVAISYIFERTYIICI